MNKIKFSSKEKPLIKSVFPHTEKKQNQIVWQKGFFNIGIGLLCLLFTACSQHSTEQKTQSEVLPTIETTALVILGTIQDAGSPHIACKKDCCADLFANPDPNRQVVSLGVIDPLAKQTFLFEATPDMPRQLKRLKQFAPFDASDIPSGIFITHAHIGHYTGLMYLGKEATNAKKAPVYAMPKMTNFLRENGPWSQLVTNENIALQPLVTQEPLALNANLEVTPFTVPHRDEYSETVGYTISGPNKRALFIPDIDKWEKWDTDIIAAIAEVDYAFLDGTFYDAAEINHRDISEIPHPFVIESMEKFKDLPDTEKAKIYFIHFNHTNPIIRADSPQTKTVLENGFGVAQIYDVFEL